MAKRIIAKGTQHYVKWCPEWQEYTVYDKAYPDLTYHTDCKADAIGTMESMDRDYVNKGL